MTKDILQDIVTYTASLGGIDTVKIVGSSTATKIEAMAEDRTVIVRGSAVAPVPQFTGTFGMPNLTNLRTILSFDEYDEKANISVITTNRDGVDVPTAIHFETQNGDFVNDYRLMAQSVVEERVKLPTFHGATWNIDFQPLVSGIQRLKKQAQANNDQSEFNIRCDSGDLKIHFGDPSTHSGNFVFQSGISGKLNRSWYYPVKQFLSIMDMAGVKHIYISDQGAMRITVDSGIAQYEYLLPAKTR